jgi:hypothetical protein
MKNSNLEIKNPRYSLITKIQSLSESKRKIILWLVMIIISLGLFTFYIKSIQKRLKSFEFGPERLKEELKLPSLKKEFESLPKIEIPRMPEEILK